MCELVVVESAAGQALCDWWTMPWFVITWKALPVVLTALQQALASWWRLVAAADVRWCAPWGAMPTLRYPIRHVLSGLKNHGE